MNVLQYLQQGGFLCQENPWKGCLVAGQKRTFKLRWIATALWENVVVYEVKHLDVPTYNRLLMETRNWALANKKGAMRGMQSGQVFETIIIAKTVDPIAAKMVRGTWNFEFAQFTLCAAQIDGENLVPIPPRFVGSVYKRHLLARLHGILRSA